LHSGLFRYIQVAHFCLFTLHASLFRSTQVAFRHVQAAFRSGQVAFRYNQAYSSCIQDYAGRVAYLRAKILVVRFNPETSLGQIKRFVGRI